MAQLRAHGIVFILFECDTFYSLIDKLIHRVEKKMPIYVDT